MSARIDVSASVSLNQPENRLPIGHGCSERPPPDIPSKSMQRYRVTSQTVTGCNPKPKVRILKSAKELVLCIGSQLKGDILRSRDNTPVTTDIIHVHNQRNKVGQSGRKTHECTDRRDILSLAGYKKR